MIGNNHKGETLYGFGGCKVLLCGDYKWMGFGDKETHPKYQGQVKDGKPNGLGVLIYPNGSKYVGSWDNGEELKGTFTHFLGTKYVGSWNKGKWWNGILYDEYGKIYSKYDEGEDTKQ